MTKQIEPLSSISKSDASETEDFSAQTHTLVAVYAADALPLKERDMFENHLLDCSDCDIELRDMQETLALLALDSAVTPPSSMRKNVLDQIKETRQLPPLVEDEDAEDFKKVQAKNVFESPSNFEKLAPVVPLKKKWYPRIVSMAAGLMLFGGGVLFTNFNQSQPVPLASPGSVIDASDARLRSVETESGISATLVSSSKGVAVLLEGLSSPGFDQAYQGWIIDDEGPHSAGLMTVKNGQAILLANNDLSSAHRFGVTLEPKSGSKRPTTTPVLLADLPA